MNNGLVRRGPRGAETGKFAIDAIAPKNIGGRYRLAAPLVGHRALDDRPVDAPSKVVFGCVDYIIETAIDNRFESVEPRLGPLARRVAVSSLPPVVGAWCSPAA